MSASFALKKLNLQDATTKEKSFFLATLYALARIDCNTTSGTSKNQSDMLMNCRPDYLVETECSYF